jgi:hypothetical protein
MGRLLFAAAAIYCAAFPAFETWRPAALDRSMRSFRQTVDAAVAEGRRATTAFDDARRMRRLQSLIDRWPSTF